MLELKYILKFGYITAFQIDCITAKTKNNFLKKQIMQKDRTIVHMDLDSFFVSVSRLENSALHNKPVIVGGTSDRGVVAACSYEARAFGVHSAMPIKLARRLCPDAIIIRGDYDRYSYYSEVVTDIIKEDVPVYEKSSIDEFYIDMTGMDRFFGCYNYTTELRQRIMKETGLPISFGLSENKTVSKVATGEAKPNGQKKIDFGDEKVFLGPLSIKKIPMVGDKTYTLLRSMGVERVYTLQEMPPDLLTKVLGENGFVLWKKANGIDNTPVEPYSERKSISTEETFEQDTADVVFLKSLLVKMTEKLAFQLRSENKLTACITVKIRYSNFDTHTTQSRISYTSSDHTLIAKAKELFDKLYERRMLIRLIGIRFSHLVGGGNQINLFEDSEEIINLYQAMDHLRKKFGNTAVLRAVGLKGDQKKKSDNQ
jgi:DNA polymerase-4